MQKLLTRYETARAELNTPPNSVAQIMECDEARTQLIRALGAPYNISHNALVERAIHSIAGDTVMAEWRPYKPAETPPITEIDDYSDMKPPHVSPLTWAVAIVAFILIWSLAIYVGLETPQNSLRGSLSIISGCTYQIVGEAAVDTEESKNEMEITVCRDCDYISTSSADCCISCGSLNTYRGSLTREEWVRDI